jgi:hypothetical protein
MFQYRQSALETDFSVFSWGANPVVHGYKAGGTQAAPLSIRAGEMVFGLGSRTWTGSSFTEHSTSAIHMVALEDHTSNAQGTDFRILVTPVGSSHEGRRMAVQYLASPTGMRCRMRLSGADAGRMMFQTDEVGANTSLGVVPHGGNASNIQARDSHTPNFGRVYLEANAVLGNRLVADAVGAGTLNPLHVDVGGRLAATFDRDGSTTHHNGTRMGADAPLLRVKKLTGTTASEMGGTALIPHGLPSSSIRDIRVIVRPAATQVDGVPPRCALGPAGREYGAYFGTNNVAVVNHPTNSANILSSEFTCLVTYEVTS